MLDSAECRVLQLFGGNSLNLHPRTIDTGLCGDVESHAVFVAKGHVGRLVAHVDSVERFGLRRDDVDVISGNVEVAFFVNVEAVGRAVDVVQEDTFVGGQPFAVEVVSVDFALVGIGHVEDAAVGRKGEAIGAAFRLGDDGELAFGVEVVDAVEVELAGIGLVAEGWVCEVELAVFADDEVVGGVEAFTFETVGEDVEFLFVTGVETDDATGFGLGNDEVVFFVVGDGAGAGHLFAVLGSAFAGEKGEDLVVWHITEEQSCGGFGPERGLGEAEAT